MLATRLQLRVVKTLPLRHPHSSSETQQLCRVKAVRALEGTALLYTRVGRRSLAVMDQRRTAAESVTGG